MFSSDAYTTFVVGFAIMTALPFLPDLFVGRLHVPESQVSQWTALSFEVFAIATLASNAVVGFFTDASASKSKPFLFSIVIMLLSTILFFVGTTPQMIIVSRAIQGASTTFTWVTGLAYLVSQVDEANLGAYVGWTTVGVAAGEIVGPMVGGPIYDYLGHWAAFGVVEALLLVDILLRVFARDKKTMADKEVQVQPDSEAYPRRGSETDQLLQTEHASVPHHETTNTSPERADSQKPAMNSLAWNWLGTVFTLIVIFTLRGALEVAYPLYLTRQYSWTPTKISLVLLTITLPAVINPVIGKITSRQGPRWWSTGAFIVCGTAMISFGNVAGPSQTSQTLFIVHSIVVGLALSVLINANQVAMSVASQRYGLAMTRAKNGDEHLGRFLSWLSPGVMLSGVTTSWAAGILVGPAYSTLIPYTEDIGWAMFCRGLGGMCMAAALASSFLWRKW